MTLRFPNASRSFEADHNRVRFWGHDSAIEITFFLEADALLKLCPELKLVEAECLAVFDSTVDDIHRIAKNVYQRSRERAYAYALHARDCN